VVTTYLTTSKEVTQTEKLLRQLILAIEIRTKLVDKKMEVMMEVVVRNIGNTPHQASLHQSRENIIVMTVLRVTETI